MRRCSPNWSAAGRITSSCARAPLPLPPPRSLALSVPLSALASHLHTLLSLSRCSLSLRIKFLSHVFKYIDRFYVKRLSLPELAEVGSQSFHDIVFNAVKRDVRSAILEV